MSTTPQTLTAPPTPELLAAADRLAHLSETLGYDHPDTNQAFGEFLALAPKELRDQMRAKALELGLLPPVSGYTAEGEPVYSVEAIAKQLGVSTETIDVELQAITLEHQARGAPGSGVLIDSNLIHSVQ